MILFMGVAGSGKSTQGRMLADALALPWLSTGEFLRMLIAGEKRTEMLRGKLLDDREIIAMLQKIFSIIDTSKEFVLDGFPRTDQQASWLLSQYQHGQLAINAVIHLTATEEVVRQRLIKRGRLDDHQTAITERFKEYRESILPILKQFREAGVIVCDIDGEKPVPEVHKTIIMNIKT